MCFLCDYLSICIAHFSTSVSIFFLVIGYFSLSITEYSYFLLVYPFFFMVYFVIDTLVLHGQLCESFPRMFELSFIKLCSYQPGSCKEREIT